MKFLVSDGLPRSFPQEADGRAPRFQYRARCSDEIAKDSERYEFFVYKLQYHEGPELKNRLKKSLPICAISPTHRSS